MNRRRLPSRRALAIVALVATMLGSALVGVYSGGGFSDPLAKAAADVPAASSTSPTATEPIAAFRKPSAATTTATDTQTTDTNSLPEMIRRADWDQLSKLLPKGITDVHGMGGSGFQRQVKSHGIWFPVFNLANARPLSSTSDDASESYDPDSVSLTEVPLSITSASPPATRVGEPVSHTFTAVGGEPPYLWSMQPGAFDGFSLVPATGQFSGMTTVAQTLTYTLTVTDRTGAAASTLGTLHITPAEELTITTTELPPAEAGQFYQTLLTATGGMPPYTWSIDRSDYTCDPATGSLSGTPAESGSYDITITLTDSQQTSTTRQLPLHVAGELKITTASILPPAAPGAGYRLPLEVSGGTAPYKWSALDPLPPGWKLSSSGTLTGTASNRESLHRFEIKVTDSAMRSYRKRFELAIRDALIAVPSRNKVGLAWKLQEVAQALGAVQGVVIHRDGVEVYRGTGSNTIDRALPDSATLTYTLSGISADGSVLPFASTRVRLLPFSLQRAIAGVSADPFADRVIQFSPLSAGGYGAAQVPANVLGPPDGRSTYSPASQPNQIASLHSRTGSPGGSIVLEFTDNIIESGNGLDFTVFENVFFVGRDPNNRFMEPAIIEVALFEDEWHRFPTRVNPPASGEIDFRQPAYYASGFAGVNATTGDDPTNAARSGGDSFDLSHIASGSLTWIRFIRIRATGDSAHLDTQGFPIRHTPENNSLSGTGSSGFDLDAVSAVNY